MAFLNPIMLFGTMAIGVPILIHLLNRRKFKRVVWAAMRFLRISVEQNQRRLRIEDLLLLALRCLLLVLLALALARPAVRSSRADIFGRSRVIGVIILDNSYSMSQTDGVESRLGKARKAAEQVLDAMPGGSATALLLASDVVQSPIPEPSYDLNLARKLIRETRLTDRGTDLLPTLQRAIETLQGRQGLRKEIYLITDGQALGWRQLGNIRKALEDVKRDINVHLIFVGEKEEHNLGVSALRLASGLTPVDQPLRFDVQVTNYGHDDAHDVHLTLNVDADPPIDEASIDVIPAGASKNVSLFAKLHTEGFHSITAHLPEDHLPADDQRSIAVRAIKDVKVLLVDGDPGREPRDSAVFYLRNALVPVPAAEAEQFFIKTRTIAPAELAAVKFDDYDAIALANVSDFSQTVVTAFEQYLRRGGGLIFFLGAAVNPSFYNDQLFRRRALLPAEIGKAHGEPNDEEKYFKLQEKNYEHPIVAIWNDPGAGTLGSARFFRAYELVPESTNRTTNATSASKNSEAGPPATILSFADGVPSMMEREWGQGRVVLFSSTANTGWNDLAVRPSFVPLMHRTLGSIIQRQFEGLNIKVGQKFSYQLSNEFLGRDASIRVPGAAKNARELRRIELVNNSPQLQFDQTDWSGAYDISINTEPPTLLKFAAQADPAESSLEELSVNQMDSLGQVAKVVRLTGSVALRERIETDRSGTEMWMPVAMLALLLALAETMLAHDFSKPK